MGFKFQWSVVLETFPLLLSGVKLTVIITLCGLMLGFVLGIAAGLVKLSRSLLLRKLAGAYVEAIRGTPLIVQVMFLYFGLPMAVGMRIRPMTAGIVAIAVNSGAYIAEIVRGGIESVEKGQWEASAALGFSRVQRMRYILLPQALRRILPPLAGQFISTIKDSAIVSVISIQELTFQGMDLMASTYLNFEIWITVALFYLCLTLPCSLGVARLERALARRS